MSDNKLLDKAIFLTKQGELDDALTQVAKVLEIDPVNITALHLATIICVEKGYHEMAAESAIEYLKHDQNNPGIYSLLAQALVAEKKYPEIIELITPVSEILENDPCVQFASGIANLELKNNEEAIKYLERAQKLNPLDPNTHNLLGLAYSGIKLIHQAIKHYQEGLKLAPLHGTLTTNLGLAYMQIGLIPEAVKNLELALERNPLEEHTAIYHGLIFAKQHDINATHEEFLDCAQKAYDLSFKKVAKHKPEKNPLIASEHYKIKIGYVSGDMRQHPCGDFIASLVMNHNYENYDIYCYDNRGQKDHVNQVIQENCTEYRDISQLKDAEVLEILAEDKIDALVDLSGITDFNRMSLFAAKPCYLQLLWIGYFGTLAMPEEMDYLFGDHTTFREGDEKYYQEKIYKLPYSYLPGEPYGIDHEIRELPYDRNSYITFAAFNKLPKITKDVMKVWTQILKQVPNSKIYFKNTCLKESETCKMIEEVFQAEGVEKERLILEAASPRKEFLDRYNEVDISLDTFPYGGGVSTIEPLLMGVPVITWDGDRWMCRASASYLNTLGHQELIAKDLDEYVKLAVELAQEPDRIRKYRKNLRKEIQKSEINGKNFVKHFENAISELLN